MVRAKDIWQASPNPLRVTKVDVSFLIPVSCTRNENFINFQIFTSNCVTTHRTLPFSPRIFKFDSSIKQNRERENKIRVGISPNYGSDIEISFPCS